MLHLVYSGRRDSLHENLRESTEDAEVRKIVRVRTLTVLPCLDNERKRTVLLFLHESGLLDKHKNIVTLNGANLSGVNLRDAHLSAAIVTPEQLDKALSLKDALLQDGSKHP